MSASRPSPTQTAARCFGTLLEVLGGDGNNLAAARFKILEPLGAGGFGAVFEAVDARSGQHVAVKQLDDTSAESIALQARVSRARRLPEIRTQIEAEGWKSWERGLALRVPGNLALLGD